MPRRSSNKSPRPYGQGISLEINTFFIFGQHNIIYTNNCYDYGYKPLRIHTYWIILSANITWLFIMLKNSQKQFTSLELILVVIVLVSTALAGYFAYQASQDKSDYSVNIPKKSTNSTNNATSAEAKSYGDPVARLNTFYNQYISEAGKHRGDSGVKDFQAKDYVTADFVGASGGEPVLCGQEQVPGSVQVKLLTKQDRTATLEVTKVYNDGSPASQLITATMAPNTSNEWALSKVTCSQT